MTYKFYNSITSFLKDGLYNFDEMNYNIDIEIDEYDEFIFTGFTYFNHNSIYYNSNNQKYLVLLNSDDNINDDNNSNNNNNKLDIIGVICFGEFNKNRSNSYESIIYIDINKKYQNKGYSKIMIKELNKYLNSQYDILYYSKLSENGKRCHIDKIINKYIDKKTKVI